MNNSTQYIGLQSIQFKTPVYIQEYYSIVGKKEGHASR